MTTTQHLGSNPALLHVPTFHPQNMENLVICILYSRGSVPQDLLGNVWVHFFFFFTDGAGWGGHYWHLGVEARDAATPPAVHRTPPQQTYAAQFVHSAKAEKPRCRDFLYLGGNASSLPDTTPYRPMGEAGFSVIIACGCMTSPFPSSSWSSSSVTDPLTTPSQ